MADQGLELGGGHRRRNGAQQGRVEFGPSLLQQNQGARDRRRSHGRSVVVCIGRIAGGGGGIDTDPFGDDIWLDTAIVGGPPTVKSAGKDLGRAGIGGR